MEENDQNSQTLFPHETSSHGHHRSARERQRQGPMWGCLKGVAFTSAGGLILLFIVIAGGWWYLGSQSFAELVARRVAETLKARLGREVTIGGVVFDRAHLRQVVLEDVLIANAPGALEPHFATVKQIVITGGVDSFWRRSIKVGRIDIVEPHLNFEIYPAGSKLTHNFPQWNSGPPSPREIVHIELDKMFVKGGVFSFNDRRHQITAVATDLGAEMTITRAKNLYVGLMTSPRMTLRIQDYVPIDLNLRGGFRFTPGRLELQSIAMKGRGLEAFVSGAVAPLSEGVYNLRVTSQANLERVREIFRINKTLKGVVSLDTRLRGTAGTFTLTGGFVSPRIVADAYELTDAKGKLDVNGERTTIDVDSARYGGGTIGAHYILSQYAEPYPMNVELRYKGISIEKLFDDWTVRDTGLNGGATGHLTYHWNKDKVLEGAGTGTAELSKNASASGAKYPIPIGGSTDFALDNGVVTFRRLELDTRSSHISATGTLRIEDVFTDLLLKIHSNDFSELDQAGFNFAHSAGKKTYTLLGLGGSGDISGSVKGKLKTPQVVAHITGNSVKYNDVLLGNADIDLHYDGVKSVMTFDRAVFVEAGGRLALTGTVAFPDRGPSPQFDIAVDATNYPIDRAMAAVSLKLSVGGGLGTGKLVVSGTPDSGKVTFANLVVDQGASQQLRLSGDVNWEPGKGNVRFNLDIATRDFPVKSILTFLDLATFPVTGKLTGTLHLEGPKSALEGAGAVTVRNGTIQGEPIDVATADIVFTQGKMKATNVTVSSPAGEIKGEAELNLTTNQFSYNIASGSIDLSKVGLLASIKDLLGGKIKLTSTGGGDLDHPELVIEATLNEATLKGLALPPDAPPPTIYIAIRGGRLIVRGSAANVLTIEGDGAVGTDNSIDGLVHITITNIAKLLAMSPNTATIPATGNAIIELKLGGKLSPVEALIVDATVPTLNLRVSEHEFTPRAPLRLGLRQGRIVFDSFELQRTDSVFAVGGFAEILGAKRLGIDLRGDFEAALLQLFMKDVRAEGHVALNVTARGTLAAPAITGTAELQNAQVKFAGFPQLIDNINGTLVFRGDRIDIDSLHATVGGGTVVAGGFVTVNGLSPNQFRVSIQGTDVSIRYFEGVTTEGTFTIVLSGDMERATLQGDARISRALYFKDFNFQQAILNVMLARRGVTPIVAANWQDRVSLRLHLLAPNTLAVRNNIADVTGSADIDVNGTLANPIILGTVTLNEGGKVTFQKVDYQVVRGTINFQNPFRIDPYFDVTIEGRVSGGISEVETGPLDVTVNITGTLDRITPAISSDPPASDITLFSILGFGSLTRGTTAGSNIPGMGESFLIQSIASALGSRIFPFADSFTYDPGQLDTGRKVSFEKRVATDFRLLVVYNLDNAKSREVLEWAATRDWDLQLTNDQALNQYRLDARFRRLYEGRWSLSGHGHGQEIFPVQSMPAGFMPTTELHAPPATTAVAAIPAGTVVSDIQFRFDRPIIANTLMQFVSIKKGQPLTIRDVQSTVKTLYATGNFRDVRVNTAPVSNGVEVTIGLFLNYRVGKIVFDGLHGTERIRAMRDVRAHSGDILSLNAVENSAVSVQEQLKRDGYLEATVDPETTYISERNLADVTFHVTEGPRAKVSAVHLEGDLAPFSETELIAQMREKPGSMFRLGTTRFDADRIRNYLVRQDYRRADVKFLTNAYDQASKTVVLNYRVNVGPKVKVEVTGISKGDVRKVLPFERNQEYSEDIIDRAAEDIVKLYQERGYLRAAADTESKLAGNVLTVTFNVRPGEPYRLTQVDFNGNIRLKDKELAGTVQTSVSGGFRRLLAAILRRPTGVTEEQLKADRDTLESYYRLQGFSQATVATPLTLTHPDGTLTVEFPINEGPQTIVAGVVIEGNEQIESRRLPRLKLRQGKPLNPQLEREDVVALQTFYANRGNAEVQVKAREDVSADKTSAKVTYVLAEGERIHVDEVVVRGNTYTDSVVVLKKAEIKQGDPFSYTAILEAQRNLYRLGIFNRVDLQPEQAGTSVSKRNIVISVEEGKNLTTSGSVGFLYDGATRKLAPRLAAAIAHRNLFGTGRYIGFQGIWARNVNQEAILTYREPFIGPFNIPVQFTLFQTDDSTRKNAHIQQRGTSIELSKVAFERTRWSIQYQYKISECKTKSHPDPEQQADDLCFRVENNLPVPTLPRSLLNIQISSVTPTFFWDTRDDIVDPHRGFFTSASASYAFPVFSAKAQFTKEFLQGAWYIPLSSRSVFAVSARAGSIQPIGPTEVSRFVPLSERFVGGGEASHRAFGLDQLGELCVDPREAPPGVLCVPTLFNLGSPEHPLLAPIGGSGLLIMNVEYRFPIFGPVGAAVFTDIGNVYGTSKIQFGDLRYGVGTGVRYVSPLGPLRLDVGFKLRRRIIGELDGKPILEDPYAFHLSFGYAF